MPPAGGSATPPEGSPRDGWGAAKGAGARSPPLLPAGDPSRASAAVAATAPYDFILSPTSPILAYEAELPAPGNDPRDALPHIAFTVPYNMSEQPAASINWSYGDEGLPIGLQVIGRRFDDAGVLRVSRLLEKLRPAQRDWPEPR